MPSYNSADVDIIFGGVRLSGLAPDSFVDIEYDEDSWKLMIGADGEAVRSKVNNLSATITIRLTPSSFSNSILHGQWMADQATSKAAVPLLIKDGMTGTSHTSDGAWVQKQPKKDYQVEAQPMEWTIRTGRLMPLIGFSKEVP